jgi:hypothetical protein
MNSSNRTGDSRSNQIPEITSAGPDGTVPLDKGLRARDWGGIVVTSIAAMIILFTGTPTFFGHDHDNPCDECCEDDSKPGEDYICCEKPDGETTATHVDDCCDGKIPDEGEGCCDDEIIDLETHGCCKKLDEYGQVILEKKWNKETEICCEGNVVAVADVYVGIVLAQQLACDGAEVDVDLSVAPGSVIPCLTNVQFTATKPGGGTNFDNPDGQGITISQRSSDITEWKIDNVRWYSTQTNHCNYWASYHIKAQYNVGESQFDTATYGFTADATSDCIGGGTDVVNVFSGNIAVAVDNVSPGVWHATVDGPGTFQRDILAIAWVAVHQNSQYYSMVSAEEWYHKSSQFENPSHPILQNYWLASNVISGVIQNEPYTGASQQDAIQNILDALTEEIEIEIARSGAEVFPVGPVRCALEEEAKTAVGVTHRVTMPCTYLLCP